MQLQQEINALGLSAVPNPTSFQGGALGLFGYDLGAVSKRCPSLRRRIFPCQTWLWGCMTGR
jgi:para-aminobenzoate synthetase component 1